MYSYTRVCTHTFHMEMISKSGYSVINSNIIIFDFKVLYSKFVYFTEKTF